MHPRFIAVLLQLGDALDIDNDRFHPFAQAFLGKLPMQSQAHYDTVGLVMFRMLWVGVI